MTAIAIEVPTTAPTAEWGRRIWSGFVSALDRVFGATAIIVGLAVLSAIPLAQFLVLGYFLEVGGRVARTGRLSAGFVGVRRAARIGAAAIGIFLCWLPLWPISTIATNAQIIDPDGPIARGWRIALILGTIVFIVHIMAACLRGGRLWYFFWPLNALWLARRAVRGGFYREARDAAVEALVSLRLPYYFSLGLRGYLAAFIWLFVPSVLMGRGHEQPVLALIGIAVLSVVSLSVPFMQIRLARDDRFGSGFGRRSLGREFARAPIAHLIAVAVALTSAVPLYLMKIEAIPRELVFLESLAFLAFGLPARWIVGWALHRSTCRETPRHWTVRWLSFGLMLPFGLAYALVVFASQHVGWGGVTTLFEQHAFLLPVPFAHFGD